MATTSFSLLERLQRQSGEEAWQRLNDAYAPMIRGWLSRQQLIGSDRDDVVQDVLLVVFRKLPSFQHNRRPGAFRTWLRTITVNCLRDFWKNRRLRPIASGDTSFEETLNQLADERSDVSQRWNDEHDLAVTRQLLAGIRHNFEEITWKAFELVALQEQPPSEVSVELGISISSVYQAKSRVLSRLRQEAAGLID